MPVSFPHTVEPPASPVSTASARRSGRRTGRARAIMAGCVVGAAFACVVDLAGVVWGSNSHAVVPGRAYRSAQPTGPRLDEYADRHGIRTVISLRGPQHKQTWLDVTRTAQGRRLSLEVVTLSPRRLPSPSELQRLIEVFDRSEPPILIHCREGADRTGLASTAYVLLYTDADLTTARRHCSVRFGHLGLGREAAADEFFDRYVDWLARRGEAHSPARFRQWATTEYCPGPYRARLELVSGPVPAEIARSAQFVIRAHNTSTETWHFDAGGTGIHVDYTVYGPDGSLAWHDRAGLFEQTVPPGASVDLTLPIGAPTAAGRYELFVDLVGPKGTFTQFGSEPLTHEWDVSTPAEPRRR
jgi:hypothetical protein